MMVRAAYVAVGIALAMPGSAYARDCAGAETALAAEFDRLHADNDRISGAEFRALSEGEKEFWTSNFLAAQIRRLSAMFEARADVPADKLKRAEDVFLALDAAEPCYKGDDTLSAAFLDEPDEKGRERLRSTIKESQ